jgi:two-component system sensor histidine kinase UhpB
MPLRLRLIALIGLVLLVSLACGSVLVAWHAASSVQTELGAALDVGRKTVRNGFDELAGSNDRVRELRHLVATFNGNRHVRATLLDATDQPLAVSSLFVPTQPVPVWFRRLIGGDPGAVRLAVASGTDGIAAIALQADPSNEVGEVWASSRDSVLILAGFALLSAVLICGVIGRALRPIDNLLAAFEQIGKGDYHGRIAERGPPELTNLAGRFNVMTERLATIAAQNCRLNERLRTLQAEERAELARDLHDEIGPLLFAVDMTAATIERFVATGRTSEVPTQVRLIHDAIDRMQRHVRAILGRLRPINAIGLAAAVDRLAAFWRSRRPDIEFRIAITAEQEHIDDELRETIYRIVQEGVSNAILHGKPTRVEVAVRHDGIDGICVEVADNGTGMLPQRLSERGPAQLGLVGMRERVTAMAGCLTIEPGRSGTGLALLARFPCVDLQQPQHAGALK